MTAVSPTVPADNGIRSAGRGVLIAVVGLHLISETALTPYYPQLFRALYAVDRLDATGRYLLICRVVGFLALPLWGLAARRWSPRRLVFAGLCASAVFDAALGFAPSLPVFTVLSSAVVATNTALLLAYPALIATYDGGDRVRGVRAYVTVFHAAMVASTLVGAVVLALPSPRMGISAFAVLDICLALLCYSILGPRGAVADHLGADHQHEARSEPNSAGQAGRVIAVAALAVIFEIAASVIRPFFVDYALTLGVTTTVAALLFLLPHVAALLVMPMATRVHRTLGRWFLPVTFLLAAAGLAIQAIAPDPGYLVLGRLIFGAGLGLGQVALDLRMFEATGTAGPMYTVVETARAGALFAAPVLATAAASHQLAWPLAAAAVLYAGAAILSRCLPSRSEPCHAS